MTKHENLYQNLELIANCSSLEIFIFQHTDLKQAQKQMCRIKNSRPALASLVIYNRTRGGGIA